MTPHLHRLLTCAGVFAAFAPAGAYGTIRAGAALFGRHVLAITLTLVLLATLSPGAVADDYPDRPIRLLVGFGAGGPTDVIARALADHLSADLGQRVVVENKTGASGNLATQAAAVAEADGYTYLIGASPLAINHTLFPDFPFKFGRDIEAVAAIGGTDNVLVVRPSLNVRTVEEFIRRARAHADAVSYATVGLGSSSHLAGVAFDLRAGTKMLAVSYRGGGEALKDLLAGQVDAWFATIPSVLGAVQGGQLVALATTGPRRVAWLPDVPTLAETGFPGFDIRLWVGLFARTGVPAERMRVITDAIAKAMASQDMQHTMANQAITPLSMSGTEFAAFVALEIERWKGIVAAAK